MTQHARDRMYEWILVIANDLNEHMGGMYASTSYDDPDAIIGSIRVESKRYVTNFGNYKFPSRYYGVYAGALFSSLVITR